MITGLKKQKLHNSSELNQTKLFGTVCGCVGCVKCGEYFLQTSFLQTSADQCRPVHNTFIICEEGSGEFSQKLPSVIRVNLVGVVKMGRLF